VHSLSHAKGSLHFRNEFHDREKHTTDTWRRFANFPCPVRTHHASFVLNHLECAQLHRSNPFAESCAPSVHQIALRKRTPGSPATDYFRDSRKPSMVDTKHGDHFPQADLSSLIGPTWITSGLSTIRPESPVLNPRLGAGFGHRLQDFKDN
jgi:hypothetical protein